MEGTSCGEDCCFVKSGFCDSEKGCPNYTESFWEETSTGKMKTVRDCAPKRTMLEQQRLVNSYTMMTGSMNELRDKIDNLEKILLQIINESKIFIAEIEEGNITPIEYKRQQDEKHYQNS